MYIRLTANHRCPSIALYRRNLHSARFNSPSTRQVTPKIHARLITGIGKLNCFDQNMWLGWLQPSSELNLCLQILLLHEMEKRRIRKLFLSSLFLSFSFLFLSSLFLSLSFLSVLVPSLSFLFYPFLSTLLPSRIKNKTNKTIKP